MREARVIVFVIWFSAQSALAQQVTVSGRDSRVNLGSDAFRNFELTEARIVSEAFYDSENRYLVYRIRTNYYQRCEVPAEIIENWRRSDTPDSYFRREIEDRYECTKANTPSSCNDDVRSR